MESDAVNVLDVAVQPLRVAVSRPAWRIYIGAALFSITSLTLFGLAIFSYVLFYTNYLPELNVERVVHLQFGTGNPSGVAYLSDELVSGQAYDIFVHLDLPRTPSNVAAGNFMLDLCLVTDLPSSIYETLDNADCVVRSRRPAVLTYASPIVESLTTAANIPWLILGWRREAEQLIIPILEGVKLGRTSSGVPKALMLEVQTQEKMVIYSLRVNFIAKFRGIRWLMYNHRFIALVTFSSIFFLTSLLSAAAVWTALWILLGPKVPSANFDAATEEQDGDVTSDGMSANRRQESRDLEPFDISDTPRTFHTTSRQPPLRYLSTPRSTPARESGEPAGALVDARSGMGEADDEDELLVSSPSRFNVDSGIGTSMEEGSGRSIQRRRKKGGVELDGSGSGL